MNRSLGIRAAALLLLACGAGAATRRVGEVPAIRAEVGSGKTASAAPQLPALSSVPLLPAARRAPVSAGASGPLSASAAGLASIPGALPAPLAAPAAAPGSRLVPGPAEGETSLEAAGERGRALFDLQARPASGAEVSAADVRAVAVADKRANPAYARGLAFSAALIDFTGSPALSARVEQATAELDATGWSREAHEVEAARLGLDEPERRQYLLAAARRLGARYEPILAERAVALSSLGQFDDDEEERAYIDRKAATALYAEMAKQQAHVAQAWRELDNRLKPASRMSETDFSSLAQGAFDLGLSPLELRKLLATISLKRHDRAARLEREGSAALLREEIAQAALEPFIALTPAVFADASAAAFRSDKSDVEYVLSLRQAGEARQDADARVRRHINADVMGFLVSHPGVKIRVYGGDVQDALRELHRDGYSEVTPLTRNRFTDFSTLFARDPRTGAVVFAAVSLGGRSYRRDIAAHFLYYGGGAIDPARVDVRVSEESSPRRAFERALEEHGLDPDVIVMGNVDQLARLMREPGGYGEAGKPARIVDSTNLYGYVYELNGKQVLSLAIQPYLFGDRAGELIRAAGARSRKERVVIFAGAAGSLDPGIEVGDLVAPGRFSRADTAIAQPARGAANSAAAYFERRGFAGKPGVFSGGAIRHGAVDSILFESPTWIQAHSRGEGRLSIVEQEAEDVSRAAEEIDAELFAFFRISDKPGTREELGSAELNRRASRAPVSQGDVMLELLRGLVGSDAQAPPVAVRPKDSGAAETGQIKVVLGRPYALRVPGLPAIARVDRAAAREQAQWLESRLARLSAAPPPDAAQALGVLAREFERRFGLAAVVD